MEVVNGMTYPGLSDEIKDFFTLVTTVKFTKRELDLIGNAMLITTQHPDFPNLRKRKLSVIFIDSDILSLKMDKDSLGEQGNIAVINHVLFRTKDEFSKVIIVVEEIVHHFWDTNDEPFVKGIVLEIIKDLCPGVTYDFKNMLYLLNGYPMGLR